jgi:hypothetical protein
MPRHLTGLRIFVASPGDVSEERDSLQGIVNELNRTLGDRTNTTLELVRWETHAWPGFGLDAQDVINGQIDPYDIFVGIMWKRLGTPTARSTSGTVEEFERAFDLWVQHRKPTIMFYFNRTPFYPQTTDEVQQFERVLRFKEVVAAKGALRWEYDGPDDFERQARPQLYRQIAALLGGAEDQSSRAAALRTEATTVPRTQTSAYYDMMQHFLKDPAIFGDQIRDEDGFEALAADGKARFRRFVTAHWSELDSDERDLFAEMPQTWESIRHRWNVMSPDERSSLRRRYTNIFASTNRAYFDARSPEEKAGDDRLFDMLTKSSLAQHEATMRILGVSLAPKPPDSKPRS